ncbi:tail protein X [Pseudorhizobium banfieldiae]|nr:tail protein X [Pseudorhizobium banfieldiae]CAD6606300.1 phage tail protein [arsenite-oxidising bacterium NT-25]
MKDRFLTAADGSTIYVTMDGDTVDAVAYARFGVHAKHTEEIYELNPHLVLLDVVLPAGVTIKLPAATVQAPQPRPTRQLWE